MSSDVAVADTVDDSVDAILQVVDQQDLSVDPDADDADRQEYGRELGAQIGREVGGAVGRGLAQVVVRSARENDDSRAVLADVRDFLVSVARSVLRNGAVEASLSEVREAVTAAVPTDALESAQDDAKEAAEQAGEEASDAAAEASDAASDAAEQASDAASDAAEKVTGDDGQSAGDLASLREDTLRELLEVMSYSELQSIAKEVDVKANLDRETMTEEIVSAFVEDDGDSNGND